MSFYPSQQPDPNEDMMMDHNQYQMYQQQNSQPMPQQLQIPMAGQIPQYSQFAPEHLFQQQQQQQGSEGFDGMNFVPPSQINDFSNGGVGGYPQYEQQLFQQQQQQPQPFHQSEFQQPDFGVGMIPQHDQLQQQQHQQQQHQHHHQHQQPAWVNDFSNLSIQQQHQHQNQQQNQGTKSDWHQQYMQQQQQQPNTLQHQSNFQQMTPNYAMGSYQMRNTATTMTPMFHNQTEHQQQHKLEEEQRAFEKQFDMIEKQLQNESVTTEENTNQDEAKEEFARIARKAETSMKTIDSHDSEMNEKFQNSQFLKLMSSIGNRQVELEGDKLVTSDSKEDIREKGIPETITATNPTITTAPRDTLEGQFTLQGPSNPDFAREMYDQIPALAEQSARIISGGQVQMSDWVEDYDTISDTPSKLETDSNNNPNVRPFRKGQIVDHHWDEMYRDYRHDDDYF